MSNRKWSDAQLAKCKEMYLDYKSLSEIEKRTGVPKSSLHHHIKKYWEQERNLRKAELFEAMIEGKKPQFASMTQATIAIMEKALTSLANRDAPPTMQEAAKAAEIMNTLDKITRLDDGQATDIISTNEAPLTVEVIEEKLSYDPFRLPQAEENEND